MVGHLFIKKKLKHLFAIPGLLVIFILMTIKAQSCNSSDNTNYSIMIHEFSYSEFDVDFYISRVLIGEVTNDLYYYLRARNATNQYTQIMRTNSDLSTVWV